MKTPERKSLSLLVLIACLCFSVAAQPSRRRGADFRASAIPKGTLLQIIRAEDERRWDDPLKKFLADSDAQVRKRAALAAGRIGNEEAVPTLSEMLLTDRDNDVRQMAAFALGEIESPGGAYALVECLKKLGEEDANVRARAVEALGKIVGAIISAPVSADPSTKAINDDRLDKLRKAIVDAVSFENARRSRPDELTILLGLTAVLRAKPDGAGNLVAEFLHYSDARIVADALNTLARLRLQDGNGQARDLLAKHADPIVRANAARVLGATEDKAAFDVLLDRALHDSDLRVRVSAIRALGQLKDARAADPLLDYADRLSCLNPRDRNCEPNLILELVSAIGRVLELKPNETISTQGVKAIGTLGVKEMEFRYGAPEVAIAHARIDRAMYAITAGNGSSASAANRAQETMLVNWRAGASLAQGLGEVASLPESYRNRWYFLDTAQDSLRAMLDYKRVSITVKARDPHPEYAIPEVLRAYAKFKPQGMGEVLLHHLRESDVIVRATAAELLGEQPPTESNTRALIGALPEAMRDADNDAALAILSAIGKQKNKEANDAIKTALASNDHLIRRRAVALLKANGVGDFSDRIGTVQTRNTNEDYRRAIARIGKKTTATIITNRGSFTIEFLPEDATLNVDNFIQLAKKGYFNGQTVPRVVPNFVIQTGDPRGDQSGGPGYTIRCEINEAPYERAAVGMALSGKDTGGSQWFVTHSPQPHLDGGYTVFGHVMRGMEVVDQIVRGDRIVRVVVNEK